MSYYDRIAKQWNKITGNKGGAFKELILNSKVIEKVESIHSKTILEIGTGNGYFIPLLLRKKSGQVTEDIIITDISSKQLESAQKNHKVRNAKYQKLDFTKKFRFEDQSIDIIISNMVLNEINKKGLENGLSECKRVLSDNGQIIFSVLHPEFIEIQTSRGIVKNGLMISKNGLKLPVKSRTINEYSELLEKNGFNIEIESVYGNSKLYNMKPKLKEIKEVPIALIINGYIKKY